jgi:hypothetical protein
MAFLLVSQRSSTGMQNAAVLPVPFLALARMSRLGSGSRAPGEPPATAPARHSSRAPRARATHPVSAIGMLSS